MFEATTDVLFCDVLRVPIRTLPARDEQTSLGRMTWHGRAGPGRSLFWPRADRETSGASTLDEGRLGDITFFATIASDADLRNRVRALGEDWTPIEGILDREGTRVASILRSRAGDFALPFDPGEAIAAYLSEAYRSVTAPGLARVIAPTRSAYYRLRPLLPRSVQIRLRRLIAPVQARARFPRWPIETALHDLYDRLLRLAAMVAGEPVPWLASWPRGRTWALVLTHDVETEYGCKLIHTLRDVEAELDLHSSWNFVPERYRVEPAIVEGLRAEGFEVGVHGVRHDGRDLASRAQLEARLPVMRAAAERWGAVGFRSPATQRDWGLMGLLPFDYDSSYPDTDPYEPQAGGCCSWLPFYNGELVELPLTMPQDHTLFILLGHSDESLWLEKTEHLRAAEGMVLLNTHPDYQADGVVTQAYRNYLRAVTAHSGMWHALPADVSSWWRRRAATSLVRRNGSWTAAGPASAEIEIRYAEDA